MFLSLLRRLSSFFLSFDKKTKKHSLTKHKPVYSLGIDLYKKMLISAVESVQKQVDYINSINVFPVADGDTGSNLEHTIVKIPQVLGPEVSTWSSLQTRVQQIMLTQARGNTGIIIAEFFQGLLADLKDYHQPTLTVDDFVKSMDRAQKGAWGALSNPQKGTILDVFTAASHGMSAKAKNSKDFVEVFESGLESARQALEKTKDILPQNQKAQVVDSGGAGFLFILGGMLEALTGKQIVISRPYPTSRVIIQEEESLDFRYCVEWLLAGTTLTKQELQKDLQDYGDSLHVIEDNSLFKIHIHTNNPDDLQQKIQKWGQISDWKVDDMQIMHHRQIEKMRQRSYNTDKKQQKIAFVVDSSFSSPADWKKPDIFYQVPISTYIDSNPDIDLAKQMNREEFFDRMQHDPSFVPKTSQPNPQQFMDVFVTAMTQADIVICLTLSSKLSGTYRSALQAKKRLKDNPRIHVIDTRSISAAISLMVDTINKTYQEMQSLTQAVIAAYECRDKIRAYFIPSSLVYLHRGGRLSRAQSLFGQMLHVQPVLSLDQGKIVPTKSRVVWGNTQKRIMKLLQVIQKKQESSAQKEFFVGYLDTPLDAQKLSYELQKEFFLGEADTKLFGASLVLGAHLGPGALAVMYQVD